MNTTTRCTVLGLALIGTCAAQTPYPQTAYPQQQYQQFQQQPAPQSPMRAMFATSVAQMAQATGSAAIVAVADGLTGALKTWFDNKRLKKGANGALGNNYYPPAVAPAGVPGAAPMTASSYPGTTPDAGGYPNDPNAYPSPANYPATDTYPPAGSYPADPNAPAGAPNSGYGDGSNPASTYPPTGYPAGNGMTSGGYSTPGAPAAAPSQLYAGIAYEVHLLQPGGNTVPVDPTSYTFHTGDQFRVYYRPSLPGRVDVFNINALGQTSQIDSSVIAAGQLASLGPYQFTDSQGEETLILKLSACVTQQTYAITRTIVKAQDGAYGGTYGGNQAPQPANNPMGFDDCSNTATRGLKNRPKTRDIKKVSVENGTAFALDPISASELGAGDMSPRQVTITLHHR